MLNIAIFGAGIPNKMKSGSLNWLVSGDVIFSLAPPGAQFAFVINASHKIGCLTITHKNRKY
jgi:hypothetical protein